MDHRPTHELFSFGDDAAASQWRIVNDDVMGGRSMSQFAITPQATLLFTGMLSLANNGGFASVRSEMKPLGLQPGDTLRMSMRGDGREYTIQLYVPTRQVAFSYRKPCPTIRDEWIEVALPIDAFEPTHFGRPAPSAGPLVAETVCGLGLMLADRQAGPFRLEVSRIEVGR